MLNMLIKYQSTHKGQEVRGGNRRDEIHGRAGLRQDPQEDEVYPASKPLLDPRCQEEARRPLGKQARVRNLQALKGKSFVVFFILTSKENETRPQT